MKNETKLREFIVSPWGKRTRGGSLIARDRLSYLLQLVVVACSLMAGSFVETPFAEEEAVKQTFVVSPAQNDGAPIHEFWLFPAYEVVIPPDPTLTTWFSFNRPGWIAEWMEPGAIDNWDNERPYGGVHAYATSDVYALSGSEVLEMDFETASGLPLIDWDIVFNDQFDPEEQLWLQLLAGDESDLGGEAALSEAEPELNRDETARIGMNSGTYVDGESPFLVAQLPKPPPGSPEDTAKKIIDQRNSRLREQNELKEKKNKSLTDALTDVLRTAAKDPKPKIKSGLLVIGGSRGGDTVIGVSVESGFDKNSKVTIKLNAPGNPEREITLDANGKGTAFFSFPGRVLPSGTYQAVATGTFMGNPQTGTYDRIVISPLP